MTNINSVCRAWRDAADKDLWQKLIARRWNGVETMYGEFDSHWIETMAERHLPAKADRQCALAWRDAFFDRALGRQLRRAVLQSVDLSDVLGKRLAPNAFSLHHTGWSLYSMGGKTMFAPISSVNQVMSLGSHAKILEMSSNGMSPGSFAVGRPGEKWDTDGQWLVVSRTTRNALAVFRFSDVGFSQSAAPSVWKNCLFFAEASPVTALAVCCGKLACVSKLNKSQTPAHKPKHCCSLRVHHLQHQAHPRTCSIPDEMLSACWLPSPRYSLSLLYWYKSTNTDAEGAA